MKNIGTVMRKKFGLDGVLIQVRGSNLKFLERKTIVDLNLKPQLV